MPDVRAETPRHQDRRASPPREASEEPSRRTGGPLGILGGGQLGRMTIQAAADLGLDVVVAERAADSPAARLTSASVVFEGGWGDERALQELARRAPVVTLENEFVDARLLERLQELGSRVLPTPASVATVQDKLLQKQALARAGLAVPPFAAVERPEDVVDLGRQFGWPLMLKARRDGYDGYGNALVRNAEEAQPAGERLGWPARQLYAEAFVPFERELSVVVVRGQDGQSVTYPVVESQQDPERHVCRVVLAPAALRAGVGERAAELARRAVAAVGGVGTFGIELFLLPDGGLSINEMAPRPHNSGHYTIEACATSQFANHVRAVLGLPLGEPTMRAPAAAMVNLLGGANAGVTSHGLEAALLVPWTYVHLYGKRESRPGRKMGHVTALGATLDEALERASRAASVLTV